MKLRICIIATHSLWSRLLLLLQSECFKGSDLSIVSAEDNSYIDSYKFESNVVRKWLVQLEKISPCLIENISRIHFSTLNEGIAFRKAVEAGRLAFLSGLGNKNDNAQATSPLTGFLN